MLETPFGEAVETRSELLPSGMRVSLITAIASLTFFSSPAANPPWDSARRLPAEADDDFKFIEKGAEVLKKIQSHRSRSQAVAEKFIRQADDRMLWWLLPMRCVTLHEFRDALGLLHEIDDHVLPSRRRTYNPPQGDSLVPTLSATDKAFIKRFYPATP